MNLSFAVGALVLQMAGATAKENDRDGVASVTQQDKILMKNKGGVRLHGPKVHPKNGGGRLGDDEASAAAGPSRFGPRDEVVVKSDEKEGPGDLDEYGFFGSGTCLDENGNHYQSVSYPYQISEECGNIYEHQYDETCVISWCEEKCQGLDQNGHVGFNLDFGYHRIVNVRCNCYYSLRKEDGGGFSSQLPDPSNRNGGVLGPGPGHGAGLINEIHPYAGTYCYRKKNANCVSGDTGVLTIEQESGGATAIVAAIKNLKVGDSIVGLDNNKEKAVCKVEAVPFMGRATTYNNYTNDHYMLTDSGTVAMNGEVGEPIREDTYQVLTDCPFAVDESGKAFTFSICTPGDGSDMAWWDYLSVHAAFLRLVRATKLRDMSALKSGAGWRASMPTICREALECIRGADCDEFEDVMTKFIDAELTDEARALAVDAFPARGIASSKGSVSDLISLGKSTKVKITNTKTLRGVYDITSQVATSDGPDETCISGGNGGRSTCEGMTATDGNGCIWCGMVCLSPGEAELALSEGWVTSCDGEMPATYDQEDSTCIDASPNGEGTCLATSDASGTECAWCVNANGSGICAAVSQSHAVSMFGYSCP